MVGELRVAARIRGDPDLVLQHVNADAVAVVDRQREVGGGDVAERVSGGPAALLDGHSDRGHGLARYLADVYDAGVRGLAGVQPDHCAVDHLGQGGAGQGAEIVRR